jgi:hypothetical protein
MKNWRDLIELDIYGCALGVSFYSSRSGISAMRFISSLFPKKARIAAIQKTLKKSTKVNIPNDCIPSTD